MHLGNVVKYQLSLSIGKNFVQTRFCTFTGTKVKIHQSSIHIFMCIYTPWCIYIHTFHLYTYHINVVNYLII